MKILFMIGAVAMVVGFLFILLGKNPGSSLGDFLRRRETIVGVVLWIFGSIMITTNANWS